MYRPWQPAPTFTFKLPLRLLEAVFGRDNFDDCGDWLQGWLAEHQVDQPRLACDFETAHANPWFHTLNFTVQLPDAQVAQQLVLALKDRGLLD